MDLTKEEFEKRKARGDFNSKSTYESYLAMRKAQRELAAQQRAALPEYERRILEEREADFKARKAGERQAA